MTLDGKTVLVTGGTGSFGKKFAEVVLRDHNPQKLIVYSRDEMKQQEMRDAISSPLLRYFIGDVRDQDRLRRAMQGVDVVVHAAALKQVPACEYNPMEAVKTNVMGSQNVIEAAIDSGVAQVIALSTDKAVNPVNIYGATKLCAEKIFVQSNAYSGSDGTRFSCVRYGNVAGSRGSVIPLFASQKETGRITITDDRMTRFWITLEQGVKFVTDCLEEMDRGEIFVPKIPSMRISELAQALAPECAVDIMGIRPGEKLHEVLISKDEARTAVELGDKYVIIPPQPWFQAPDWHQGTALEEDFEYTSDNNTQWLTHDQLRAMASAVA